MVAGIAILAAPTVVLGSAGVCVATHIKNKRLREAKEITYLEYYKIKLYKEDELVINRY